ATLITGVLPALRPVDEPRRRIARDAATTADRLRDQRMRTRAGCRDVATGIQTQRHRPTVARNTASATEFYAVIVTRLASTTDTAAAADRLCEQAIRAIARSSCGQARREIYRSAIACQPTTTTHGHVHGMTILGE